MKEGKKDWFGSIPWTEARRTRERTNGREEVQRKSAPFENRKGCGTPSRFSGLRVCHPPNFRLPHHL